MSEDDKVKRLGVKFKEPPSEGDDDNQLRLLRFTGCNHKYHWQNGRSKDAHYLIREGETEVECGLCGTRLDPMFVLKHLAEEESTWKRRREIYQDEMQRLNERRRTKCEHCERMTRIKR